MEVFRPELQAFPLVAFIDEGRATLGAAVVDELLARYGVSATDLSDKSAWISLEFAEAFIDEMAKRSGEPDFIAKGTGRGMSPEYIGALYPLLFAFGNPMFTYGQVVQGVGRFNKIGIWAKQDVGPGQIVMTWTPRPDSSQETNLVLCKTRGEQIRLIPTLFGHAPATIEHPTCLMRGDACCVYQLTWHEPPSRRHGMAGFVVGAILGSVVGLLGDIGPLTALMAAGFGTAGWALGRLWIARQDLADRIDDLAERGRALETVTQANEQRYAELFQAKTEVDAKVEEATQQLSDTLAEVQAMDRAKTEFFNNVSHELRSPLTLILAPLEDLVAGRTPAGGRESALATMQRNAARLLHLINQLLDLAKLDAGEAQIAPAPTNLNTLVQGVIRGFESAAHGKEVRITVTGPGEIRDVMMDARWIESAVGNLLGNALKFTERGGEVRIAIADNRHDVAVAVSDSGPGIAPEDHDRVFERFAQTDISAKVVGGTGIGLALVREAARLHGGDVTLDSEPGKGATFILTLPRIPASTTGAQSTAAAGPSQQFGPALVQPSEADGVLEHAGPSPEAPLALVVEDNADLRQFMINTLGVDYRVRAAEDGAAGLKLALELGPDVIVSDIAMPNMNGFELCRALRAEERTHATPILVVTARTDVSSVLEGFDAGASDYILKPFHGRELLARVDVHVRLRRLAHELALRERHAMLGVIAASVAHQVRNPLTTLVSGLPAMRARNATNLDAASTEMMDIMIDCAHRIEELTTDLMDISRVDRAEGGDFKPSEGLRSAIRLVRARLPIGVSIEEQVEDATVIHGRPGDMNQVFLNLLDNAARAVGAAGRVRVQAADDNGHYTVRIGDSGEGLDEATARRVFEPFFTTRPAGEGTGLGLAIASQVVERHGGRIELGRSSLGGAEFTVRIPTTRSSRQPVLAD